MRIKWLNAGLRFNIFMIMNESINELFALYTSSIMLTMYGLQIYPT